MYEKEEQKLTGFKDRLEQVALPLEAADGAIMQGLERAKREKLQARAKRKRTLWSLAAAALIILTLVTTIRVSPAFANAVASIPGMEKFVELIQNDKGLQGVFENEYYQPIGESQTIGNATLTIDGVILDESGMNIFYTIESAVEMGDIVIEGPALENQQDVPPSSISYNHPITQEDSPRRYSDILGFTFQDPVKFEDLNFTLELPIILDGTKFDFSVPFTIPENVKPSIVYEMNEEVEVEGQKFTVKDVTIHPLRIGVRISFDSKNTMKVLQFEDMRLEDQNGEVWGSIMNGISSRGEDENGDYVYFLQSNYFETPEELFLRINKMQAVDKENAFLVIDTEIGSLINTPKDDNLEMVHSSRDGFELTLKTPLEEEFNYGLGAGLTDANGKKVDVASEGMGFKEDNIRSWTVDINDDGYINPVKMELFAYPNYINGDVKIELKK
ncbi:DUF4179 domain-containing protein [Planomicrobium okeanokoites]|uniref:DUF4179 domain-containing protein n=1 Tax=Planomicrobium okeanokoites TaxID=244 RepID=UPI000A04DC8D|nr:DUF4179 domain-containing protein [Planomicrobium okeanokoites]